MAQSDIMARKKLQIQAGLTEFVYTAARETPTSVKRHLPEKYFNAIATEKGAQRFASRSSLEEKIEFLAYFGVETFLVFSDTKSMGRDKLRYLIGAIKEPDGTSTDSIKRLAEDNIFVTGNRPFCYSLLHASLAQNSRAFIKHSELLRTGYHVKKWGSKIETSEYQDQIEIDKASKVVLRHIAAVSDALTFAESQIDLNAEHVRLLLHLYEKEGYLSYQKIKTKLGGTSRSVNRQIKNCLEKMYIQKHPTRDRKEYLITATGILAINRFIEKVNKSLEL